MGSPNLQFLLTTAVLNPLSNNIMSWVLGTNFLTDLGQSAQKRDAKTSLETTAYEQSKKPQRL